MEKPELYVTYNDTLDLGVLSFPEYDCPNCGVVNSVIDVTITGVEGRYCQKCFVKNVIIPNCPIVTPASKKE